MGIRVVSLMVLAVLVLTFSGLTEFAAAVFVEKAEKSCCDACHQGESQQPDRCATPDCPIFACLAMDLESPFTLAASREGLPLPTLQAERVLEPLPRFIFHPPRTM